MPVNELVVERDAFACKSLKDEIMDRQEVFFGESRCAQSVLIAHHDELEVEFLTDESQITEDSRHEF